MSFHRSKSPLTASPKKRKFKGRKKCFGVEMPSDEIKALKAMCRELETVLPLMMRHAVYKLHGELTEAVAIRRRTGMNYSQQAFLFRHNPPERN